MNEATAALGIDVLVYAAGHLRLRAGRVDDVVVNAALLVERQGRKLGFRHDRKLVQLAVRNRDAEDVELLVRAFVVRVEVELHRGLVFDRGNGAVYERQIRTPGVRSCPEQAHLAERLARAGV